MNNIWMRKKGEAAHWIKMFGTSFFTAACEAIMPREQALSVQTEKIHLANRPGEFYLLPTESEVCPTCLQKAKNQA